MGSFLKGEYKRSHPAGVMGFGGGGDKAPEGPAKRNPMMSNEDWDSEMRKRGVVMKPAASILGGDDDADKAAARNYGGAF